MAISPVDVAVNPNNTAQRYILWGNGRIDAIGGAVPITDNPQWYNRIDQPVAVALQINSWTTGAGYVLDMQGGVTPIGGAPNLGSGSSPQIVSGIPYTDGHDRKYVDWSWDPSGSGQFYVLDLWGQIYAGGGAPAAPRAGRRYTTPRAVALEMRWSPSKMGVQLDWNGRVFPEFGATGTSDWGEIVPTRSAFRDIVVTDWSTASNIKGYKLSMYGSVRPFGGATTPWGWPYNPGADFARALVVLNPSNPLRLWEVWNGGQQFEWVSSTPPTATAGGTDNVSPATTVTDTTRPDLLWDYTDPQGDSQAAWALYVFTQSFVNTHDMSSPTTWSRQALVAASGLERTTRGIPCPVDLPNGTYRMYVRAKDTAGQWSAWSNRGWTQNVPAPATPTGLTAIANQTTYSVALSVSATTGGSAAFIRFEASDDAGATWLPVRGAETLPIATTVTATDGDAPLGVTRTYRAVAYNTDPRVLSAPSNTQPATLTTLTYLLTAVDDSSLGGQFNVQEPVAWTRPVRGGVFEGIDADFPTVVKDGGKPKARRSTLHILTKDKPAFDRLEALALSRSTLVYRDPFGGVRYCELLGDWSGELFPGAATRHMYTVDLPLIEVAPPHVDV